MGSRIHSISGPGFEFTVGGKDERGYEIIRITLKKGVYELHVKGTDSAYIGAKDIRRVINK